MLPEIFLFLLGDSTALLVTNLDYLKEDFIKLLYVLIGTIHVCEGHIEKRVDNICAKVD